MSTLASVGWPVLDRFRFGDFAISPHGIGIAIGFVTGAWLLGRIGPRRGVSVDHINTMVLWALVGAVIGSRLFYVIAHVSEFSSPLEWFQVWKGGISLLGGIAGAILINVPRFRRYGYRFFQVMDPAVICIALGIGIGRIGDLIIGDHLGKPTSWLLAWTYEGGTLAPPFTCADGVCQASLQGGHLEVIERTGARLLDANGQLIAQGVGVHQTALYDMILAWGLFALLWTLGKRPLREGVLTPHVRPLLRGLPPDRGLAADRQALRPVHGLAVDGADGRDDLADDLGGVVDPRAPQPPELQPAVTRSLKAEPATTVAIEPGGRIRPSRPPTSPRGSARFATSGPRRLSGGGDRRRRRPRRSRPG
ncbi:MAG: prolipoprotein diacylglyceryl transferase family protein [Actinomycetota bacterium]